ncbi:MAG: hypothetical protein JWP35_1610 [Caulobacter sp.]|nr:hypothetical protein [Caulobacter sp.]
MKTLPNVRAARFEQLEEGELFVFDQDGLPTVGMKTAAQDR